MAFAFDTLGYAKRFREAGLSIGLADAHAEAAREFIMSELVTKSDLQTATDIISLRLTVRLGSMLAVAVGVLAILIRMH